MYRYDRVSSDEESTTDRGRHHHRSGVEDAPAEPSGLRESRSMARTTDADMTAAANASQDGSTAVPSPVQSPSPPAAPSAKPADAEATGNGPVAWRDLPRKDQLAIITLARVSEPLVQTSLQAYLYYQLKWFDPSLPDSTISSQAGVLHASFMAAQFLTAMMWGKIADSPRAGRKFVLLFGLVGTCLSCVGFGFATSFWQALVFRTLGGATNGNIGVMRTMISEIIREKKFQSRAFLLLPMTFNIGVIIGPILGGILSDPAASYPGLFAKVGLFVRFPYVLPNLVSAVFLSFAALLVWLGLEETHHMLQDLPPDLGLRVRAKLASLFRRLYSRGPRSRSGSLLGPYESIPTEDIEMPSEAPPPAKSNKKKFTQTLPFRRIFTRNMTMTLITHFVFTFHIGTCNSLYYVFLSTPVWDPKDSEHARHLPFRFTGGLGLQPREVGIAMAILGFIGINMQIFLYPTISARLGTVLSWRTFLMCFPVAYSLMPYLAMVPSTSPPPEGKTGVLIWVAIASLLFIIVSGRTVSLPANVILINNNSPHPSVLGTVHGLGQSVSSGARTIGPLIAGWLFGYGLDHGIVGLVWWLLALVAVCTCLASLFVREGDGHEIWLEGDEVEE